MKSIIKNVLFCMLGITAISLGSCQKETLTGVFTGENLPNVKLAVSNNIVTISNGTNYTKDAAKIRIPIVINLSGPAPATFAVQVFPSTETIATLIANNTLPSTTFMVPAGKYSLPNGISIPFGVQEVTFNLDVSLTVLEQNYGKDLGFAVKITDPTKNNSIDPAKNTIVFVVKSSDVIGAADIHYVSFENGGTAPYVVPRENMSFDGAFVNILLPVSLNGAASTTFTVDVTPNTALVNTLIANNTLPNTILYPNQYFPPSLVKFPSLDNTINLEIPLLITDVLSAAAGKKMAVAFTLSNTSLHVLNPTKTTIVAVIDRETVRPYKGVFQLSSVVGEPVVIGAADYDYGGQGVAFNDATPGNTLGKYRVGLNEGVDIELDAPPPFNNIGAMANGEWITYSINVPVSGNYEIGTNLGVPNANAKFSIFIDNVNVTGILAAPVTGGYTYYVHVRKTVALTAGRHIMKFFVDQINYNLRSFEITRK